MNSLFSIKYWINTRPGSLNPLAFQILGAFLLALIVLALFSYILKKRKGSVYRKTLERLNNFSLANIAIGFFVLFFSYELVPFLSARFWLILWFAGMVVWLGFIVKATLKIPEKRKKQAEEKEFKKYIP